MSFFCYTYRSDGLTFIIHCNLFKSCKVSKPYYFHTCLLLFVVYTEVIQSELNVMNDVDIGVAGNSYAVEIANQGNCKKQKTTRFVNLKHMTMRFSLQGSQIIN